MENKAENINIEKNKELFEYEMTEVILKLKGEFAAFSGKDTGYADVAVDDAKLRINSPDIAKVKVQGCHVETPIIESVQQTETARIEVKEAALRLPVIPQIENGRKTENAPGPEKANGWQGIAVPVLPKFNKGAIVKEPPQKSLKEAEKEIISSVSVPELKSVTESTRDLKKKTYTAPVAVHVPDTKIKQNDRNKDKISVYYDISTFQKIEPKVKIDSLTVSDQLKKLSEICAADPVHIEVPHIAANMDVGIENGKRTKAHTVKVPQIIHNGSYAQVLPEVIGGSVHVDVPSTKPFAFHELKKPVTSTNVIMIELQETRSFKYEIKNPTVTGDRVMMPEINHIQTYKADDVCIKRRPISVPDTPKYNSKGTNVCIKNTKFRIVLPETEIPKRSDVKTIAVSSTGILKTPDIPSVKKTNIPNVRETDIVVPVPVPVSLKLEKAVDEISVIPGETKAITVCVPAVSFRKHKPISLNKTEKYNIDIQTAQKLHFSDLPPVKHTPFDREIEIRSVNVNSGLGKVTVSHYGSIAIPDKPDVKETVDYIISLAAAGR